MAQLRVLPPEQAHRRQQEGRAYESPLLDYGYKTTVWNQQLAVSLGETERFLECLGGPTAGNECKCAKVHEEYERRSGKM